MNRILLSAVAFFALAIAAAPAHAGNIALTGHDDDYHCYGSTADAACLQLKALISFAKNGSSLPILTFDAGSELTYDLTNLGIAYTNVNPNVAANVTASLFDFTKYSAFVVASDSSCGGCDNSPAGEANIAAQSAAIGDFLNAGGGIVGLAGGNSANYYAFVPQTATSVGGAPSSGYSQTAVGAAYGITAVDGDPTHNLFYNPGTHGESAIFQVAEVNSVGNGTITAPAATTLLCVSCTVSGGVIVSPTGTTPEPSSLVMLGSGLIAIGGAARRRFTRA